MDFIKSYLTYTEGYETSKTYDLWCALSTIASVVNRRVWVDQGYFRVYIHMYVVLVGPAGGGKTSAMEISQLMLEDIGDIMFAGTAMTKEALTKKLMMEGIKTFELPDGQLKEYTPMTFCLTELSHFLGINSAHMIDLLTTIYDKENYKSDTKHQGNDIIPGAGLNILACTTPSNITRYLKEDIISGGFSSRTNFVLSDEDGKPIPRPKLTVAAKEAREECLAWLKELKTLSGEFQFSEEGGKWYDQWYVDHWRWLERQPETVIKGYYRRKRIHLLKLSMAFALTKAKTLILEPEHLQLALATLTGAEEKLDRVYEGMGRNELSAIQARAMDHVYAAKGAILEKELLALLTKDANFSERMEIVRTMIDSGKVVRRKDPADRVLLVTPQWLVAHSSAPDTSTADSNAPSPTPPLPDSEQGSSPSAGQ